MQPDQQLDQRVEQDVGGLHAARAGEDGPVAGGVAEEPGDQDRIGVRPAVDRDADHLDRRDAVLGQGPEQAVLAAGEPFADRLEGVNHAAVGDEPHHVPRYAALTDLHQPVILPVLQRLGPREGEQPSRPLSRRSKDKPHKYLIYAGGSKGRASVTASGLRGP